MDAEVSGTAWYSSNGASINAKTHFICWDAVVFINAVVFIIPTYTFTRQQFSTGWDIVPGLTQAHLMLMGVAHGSPGFEKLQTRTLVAAFSFHEVVVQVLWTRLHLPEH